MNNDFPASLRRERVAQQCICCGGVQLQRSPAVLMPFVSHRALGLAPVLIDEQWGLKSIPQGMAYCLCNTLHCSQCELLFLDIRFSDREMACLYDGYYGEAYEALREHYEPGFKARNLALRAPSELMGLTIDYVLQYLSPVRILDWGGGDGTNTPFKGDGYQTDIFDIDRKPTVVGTRSVAKGDVEGVAYDLIVCRQVLEHVPYPTDVLAEIRQCMGDETLLYVELPHEALMVGNQALSPSQKRHWHEHINFFSPAALANLFLACGFKLLNVQSTPIGSDPRLSSASRILQAMVRKA
ncbi:class I SAM-dependent methyltransferase [Pseudomonas sp. BW16M2]|uniref:class I SAM-dependent methyltransferase n=1 Tax=Pseudomonas sp. BW16M2 TaxID=2745489 RepID=UPI001646E35A|nr:class I SAM-dependent methyltransferase [Pseudomonas sp. BW16M2]MBC3437621.1 class I SAM-dependent methyltransferase [Pseudomonas sp. BW16M2]